MLVFRALSKFLLGGIYVGYGLLDVLKVMACHQPPLPPCPNGGKPRGVGAHWVCGDGRGVATRVSQGGNIGMQ